jgi:hypothetical protein
MQYLKYAATAFLALNLLTSCNLEKEIEIDLPDYKAQPVVECYLEPGNRPIMLLTQSSDFFAPFDTSLIEFVDRIVLQGATAVVRYQGIPYIPDGRFELEVKLADGNTISSSFTMPTRTPIDSVVVEWDENRDTLARVLTYITDNKSRVEYWRRMINYASLTDSIAEQDFLVRDNINTSSLVAFGTAYELKEGDTVFNTIHSVTEDYLNYIESVQLAVAGNANPFASPSPIKSNVQGTSNPLGIFTPLIFDRDTTIIRK